MRASCANSMVSFIGAACIVVASGHVVLAQDSSTVPTFAAVSIHPIDDSGWLTMAQLALMGVRPTRAGGLAARASLRELIHYAYGMEPYERTVAANSQLTRYLEERFEVAAVPPESSSAPSPDEVRAMTRQTLFDRFALRVRWDTELARATVLRMPKGRAWGPGVRPATDGCVRLTQNPRPGDSNTNEALKSSCVVTFRDERLRGTVTLQEFARTVSALSKGPVLDQTGTSLTFRIDVSVASSSLLPNGSAPVGSSPLGPLRPSDAPAFLDALRDQMGLVATVERQPIRVLVVEHAGTLVEN